LLTEQENGPHLLAVEELGDVAGLLVQRVGVTTEDRDVALARLGERHLDEFETAALGNRADGKIVDAAKAQRGNLELVWISLGVLGEIIPCLERAILFDEDERRHLHHYRDRRDV